MTNDHEITSFWWIRHAAIKGFSGQIIGRTDAEAQLPSSSSLRAVADMLPLDARWICSPLRRARQTAKALADFYLRLPVCHDMGDLSEQNFGDWEGRTYDEVFSEKVISIADIRPPGGESFRDVIGRIDGVLGELGRRAEAPNFVIVGHGGPIRAALALALNLDPETALSFGVDHLSVTRIDHYASGSAGVAFVNRLPGTAPIQKARKSRVTAERRQACHPYNRRSSDASKHEGTQR